MYRDLWSLGLQVTFRVTWDYDPLDRFHLTSKLVRM